MNNKNDGNPFSTKAIRRRILEARERKPESGFSVSAENSKYSVSCFEERSVLKVFVTDQETGNDIDFRDLPVNGFTKEQRQKMMDHALKLLDQGMHPASLPWLEIVYPHLNRYIKGYYWCDPEFE